MEDPDATARPVVSPLLLDDLVAAAPLIMMVSRLERDGDRIVRLVPVYLSTNVEHYVGVPAAALLADRDQWWDRVHPDDRARALASRNAALAVSPFHEEIEYRVACPDGTVHALRFVLDERPADPGVVFGYGIDVTEQRRVEAARDEREACWQQIAEHTGSAIAIRDLQGRMLIANDAALRIVEMPEEEVIGADAASTFRVVTDLNAHDALVVERGETMVFDEELIGADGRTRYFMAVTFPLLDANGETYGVGTIGTDVTDRKLAADEIVAARLAAEQARDDADRANRAKSDFLSRMSHELRTPLNAILGYGQLLGLDGMTPAQQEAVGEIAYAGRHLLRLINEVLDVSAIEAGTVRLSIEPVSVDAVVGSAIGMTSLFAKERDVTIGWARPAGPGLVRADQQRTLQIVLNLLSNAIKYNRRGGSVQIDTSEPGDGSLHLHVRDTGLGIDPDDLGHVFAPFERLGAELTDIEGAGVGLAISQTLANHMGGELLVDSTKGEGSTFTLVLPLATDPRPG